MSAYSTARSAASPYRQQFGFTPLQNPDRFMEIDIKDIYQQGNAETP